MVEIITWNVRPLELEAAASSSVSLRQISGRAGKGKGRADYFVDFLNATSDGEVRLHWSDPSRRTSPCAYSVGISLRLGGGSRWKKVAVIDETGKDDERYRAYLFMRNGRDFSGNEDRPRLTLLIYEAPDTTSFMASLADSTPLGDISMPGTHESCALYGYPISQCQQPATPISRQLRDGVRFFDVRLKVVGDQLLTYHGIRPERSSLPLIFSALHSFLDSHPTETVIVLIKEETPPFHPDFTRLLHEHFAPFIEKYWFLEDRIPHLGEVRAKAILLSRFDSTGSDGWEKTGLGIHPYTWPDSYRPGFEWRCGDADFRIQDWYRVPSFLEIPEKYSTLVRHLEPTLTPSPSPQFTLSYSSASSFPFAFPNVIAKGFGYPEWGLGVQGINDRFTQWLLERIADGQRVRACVMMDFYRQEGWPGELMILMNFIDGDSAQVKSE